MHPHLDTQCTHKHKQVYAQTGFLKFFVPETDGDSALLNLDYLDCKKNAKEIILPVSSSSLPNSLSS